MDFNMNMPPMEDATADSSQLEIDIVLTILFNISSIMFAALSFYAFRTFELDELVHREKGTRSAVRKTIITAGVACVFFMLSNIVRIFDYGVSNASIRSKTRSAAVILAVIGIGFCGTSFVRVTVLTFEALALAEGGIAATRGRFLVLLRKFISWFMVGLVIALIIIRIFAPQYLDYSFGTIFFLFGICYAVLSMRFLTLSRAWISSETTEQQRIPKRCREIHSFLTIVTICLVLLSVLHVARHILTAARTRLNGFITWPSFVTFGGVMFVILQDITRITTRSARKWAATTDTALLTEAESDSDSNFNFNANFQAGTGIDIVDANQKKIGVAPFAPRPLWLPTNGAGQANVPPHRWSISLENWMKFVHACMRTSTWRTLVIAKGGKNISMYDINTHFIKPWTRGTGCSIAVLMDNNPGPVDVMISHSWAGSVTETLLSMQSLITMYFLPKDSRIFFCTMCIYQPEDGATSGLLISQQLRLKPFAEIIKRIPKYGMFVIHTTVAEVFERLWCVHEVDECLIVQINIFGAFDLGSWTDNSLKTIIANSNTRAAECQDDDKQMLTGLIEFRGGFDRLDQKIREVRQQALIDLSTAHLFEHFFSVSINLT